VIAIELWPMSTLTAFAFRPAAMKIDVPRLVWRDPVELRLAPRHICPIGHGARAEGPQSPVPKTKPWSRPALTPVGHQQVTQDGNDWDRSPRRAALWLDLAHLRVPPPLDANGAAGEVDGVPATRLRFSEPQPGVQEHAPQGTATSTKPVPERSPRSLGSHVHCWARM
jgi:hypothetical protein